MVDLTTSSGAAAQSRPARIPALDIARTGALVAMAVFHFAFDLEMFGWLEPRTVVTGSWRLLALMTAGSFLFMAGVSLWLAHGDGIRWRGFWRRFAMIAGAAMVITLATYFVFPGAFIFYGILHSIAVASLFGLLVLRLPPLMLLALAAFAFWAPSGLTSEVFNTPVLYWVGLHTVSVPSVDFVPFFPWVGPFLLGLAASKLASQFGLWARLTPASETPFLRRLGWPGRHSLAIYLIHQPVLISLVWLATSILR